MDEFNRRISGIRRAMEEMKTEMYAISNPVTAALDEYIKSLYIRMLCTVVQYENDPSEMQLLYLRRLHKGIQIDNSIEDFMRMALDISEVDVQEFIDIMRGDHARYYFALEGILLVSMGKGEQANYEYLGELIELICISKRELEYLSTVARSILEQDSEYYDKAKSIAPESVEGFEVVPYIVNFYAGAIVDTRIEKHFYAPNRDWNYRFAFPYLFHEKKVTFSNLAFEMSNALEFDGCEMIEFQNCVIKGNNYSVYFRGCGDVKFINCRFYDFSSYTIVDDTVERLSLLKCEFENCIFHYKKEADYYYHSNYCEKIGGVVHAANGTTDNHRYVVEFSGCEFRNCGGKNKSQYYRSSAIICNALCEVRDCKFINCWNYKQENKDSQCSLFGDKYECVDERNEIIGSANMTCE